MPGTTDRDQQGPPVVVRDVVRELTGVALLIAGIVGVAVAVILAYGGPGVVFVASTLVAAIGYRLATRPTPGPAAQPAARRRAGT